MTAHTEKPHTGEPGFHEVEHTADRALCITGETMEALLTHGARGMIGILGFDPQTLETRETREFELDAFDGESLLVEWLNELLYFAETEMIVFHSFDFSEAGETRLKATLRGCRVSSLAAHIKAVTYHDLNITRNEKGLSAVVVFDV